MDLWTGALEEYRKIVGSDLLDPGHPFTLQIDHCESSDDLLTVIEGTMRRLGRKREGNELSRKLRQVLKPLVSGLKVVLEASGETASSLGVPGGKGVFVAVAILLKAADDASTTFDNVLKSLDGFRAYVQRMEIRVNAPMRQETRMIAIKTLAQMLRTLAIATKMIRKNRFERFLQALVATGDEIQIITRDIQSLHSEEERMEMTELIVGQSAMSSEIHDIHTTVSHLSRHTSIAASTAHVVINESYENQRLRKEVSNMKNMLQVLVNRSDVQARVAPSTVADHAISLSAGRMIGHYSQLGRALGRLNLQDQDILWRAFATLFSWFVDAGTIKSHGETTMTTISTHVQVMETALPFACTIFLLFLMWKYRFVSRPLGQSDGTVLIVDVLGVILELDQGTFEDWDNTHAFLVQAFRGRPGASFVDGGCYALGNEEHLLISSTEWSTIVKSGSRLNMSLVIGLPVSLCPYCQTETYGDEFVLADGRIVCSSWECGRPYALLEHDRGEPLESSEARGSPSDETSYQSSRDSTTTARLNPEPEVEEELSSVTQQGPDEEEPEPIGIFQRIIVAYQEEPSEDYPDEAGASSTDRSEEASDGSSYDPEDTESMRYRISLSESWSYEDAPYGPYEEGSGLGTGNSFNAMDGTEAGDNAVLASPVTFAGGTEPVRRDPVQALHAWRREVEENAIATERGSRRRRRPGITFEAYDMVPQADDHNMPYVLRARRIRDA
ncbi:unnamed protein product [Peniophora sp. CBMAI 1063]|nr:unnamed protein product [Peniophora sp. CBMAI 1063]